MERHPRRMSELSVAAATLALVFCIACERETEPTGGLTPTPARTQPPAPEGDAPSSDVADSDDVQRFAGVMGALPDGWIVEPPASSMRATQYRIPANGEIEEGEVAVFTGIMGSNDANIARWVAQFSSDDGTGVEPELTAMDVNGMPVTLVFLQGTYSGMMPSGAPTEPQANTGFLAAIIDGPQSPLHIRMVGPLATVEANREAFLDFVNGLRPAE